MHPEKVGGDRPPPHPSETPQAVSRCLLGSVVLVSHCRLPLCPTTSQAFSSDDDDHQWSSGNYRNKSLQDFRDFTFITPCQETWNYLKFVTVKPFCCRCKEWRLRLKMMGLKWNASNPSLAPHRLISLHRSVHSNLICPPRCLALILV
uniref:Uncharacterized protein n=1 Tax=Timema poppense TaxID=170557 RepID=A0A7R9H0N1_TIMPO|nr:unnamed protein product [Timema poppensis]